MKRTAAHPCKVLIVDDEPSVRRGLSIRLDTEADLVVVGAVADAHAALELMPEVLPDLVLMDGRLPGIDGFEATAMLQARFPHVPVIVLSLYDDDTARNRALAAGAAAFVSKHDGDAALLAAIRSCRTRVRRVG